MGPFGVQCSKDPKGANRMANSSDPNQTAPQGTFWVVHDSPLLSTIFRPNWQKMNRVIISSCSEYTLITLLSEVGRLGVWHHQNGGETWAYLIRLLWVLFFLWVDKKWIKWSRVAAWSILRLLFCLRWGVWEYDVIKMADNHSFCPWMTRLLRVHQV